MPAARAAHAALHRGHARLARHRHPGSREPFPHAVAGARLARPLHHPRAFRGRRCAGGRHPPWRSYPRVRRFRPGRHLRHHRHDARPARVRRARHAVHPPPLRGGLCHHPGGHRAPVAGQARLPGHRRLRHRLQGRGAPAAGARHRSGRHRSSRALRPGARGRARGRSEARPRLPQRHPGRRGRGAQDGAGAGRALRQAAPVAPVHRLRHARHHRRPHAHARREPRPGGRRPAPHQPGTAPVHRRAARHLRRLRQAGHRHQPQLLHHPAPERRRPHGRRAAGARPSAHRRLRAGQPAGAAPRERQRPAPRHRGGALRDRQGPGRRNLQGPARPGGGRRRVARGREGHRGKPPGEHLRRALSAVHH